MDLLKVLWENKGKIGGSLCALTASIFLINQRIDYVEKNTLAIVDYKHEAVMVQLHDIKKTLEKIDQRVYELNQKTITSFLKNEKNEKEL